MRCLDIGHAPGRLWPEWVNVGIMPLPDTDFVCEWGAARLPFEDGEFDVVHASHCLEHVPWYRVVEALREAGRVLKNGGMLEIWVPDFEYVVRCYSERRCGDRFEVHGAQDDFMRWVNGKLFAYGRDGHQNFHRSAFDREYLERCVLEAGFREATRLDEPRMNNHPVESQIGVGGLK